ncbi:MAG: family 78 glycoside hydrolase catalytic domain [Lachnospiraceae bacterium]
MKIKHLRINHIERPMGYCLDMIMASYIVEDKNSKEQKMARIVVSEDPHFSEIIFDTGKSQKVSGLGTKIDITVRPRTRYYWKVYVWNEQDQFAESEAEWFESGLMGEGFQGKCITPDLPENQAPVFKKTFELDQHTQSGRMYLCGLGLYRVLLNGMEITREKLTPGLTVYQHYVQYQTYDITDLFIIGENNVEIAMADGWYKGKYGYRQNELYRENKKFELIADIHIESEDGTEQIISTDTSWKVSFNKVIESDIYDGEIVDDTLDVSGEFTVKESDFNISVIKERLGVPIVVKEHKKPEKIIRTPKDELVLDMGQNMVGWIAFCNRLPKGNKIVLEYGEVLQNNCFYRENYRTAKARFEYLSDGTEKEIRPSFTFFGFRYVRIRGVEDVSIDDFWGEVVYSDLDRIGTIQTGEPMINQLYQNALWSQKGNFLDIPSDCPQRDEKMGWTGDAQIFSATADMNMECYAFFTKYLHDISLEQKDTNGLVPQIVPSVGRNERTSAAWGDAATIIPWNLYKYYGDASILSLQYESMKGWIGYIDKENQKYGTNPNLWCNGFHYGDWLALDGGYYYMPTGGTEVFFISSAYFYYSTKILADTAAVLGKTEDAKVFAAKAGSIRRAVCDEYFTPSGKLRLDTQTAYIVALYMGLFEEDKKEVLVQQLLLRLRKDNYKLQTGFVGTPYFLPVLSEIGRDDIAFKILHNKEVPGWLYPITMGATTMWERWNSILPDGSMSSTGMNSLNHYAYGSVIGWMYEYMAGIKPEPDGAGYKIVKIHPRVDYKIRYIKCNMQTSAGTYQIEWKIAGDTLEMLLEIPFDAKARLVLPHAENGMITVNKQKRNYRKNEVLCLNAGSYSIEYQMKKDFRPCYSMEDSLAQLILNAEIKDYLYSRIPMLKNTEDGDIQVMTLPEIAKLPFLLGIGTRLGMGKEVLAEVAERISKIPKEE